MKFSAPALWYELRRRVLPPVPPEHRAGFSRSLAHANWVHGVILAPVVAGMNAVFGLLPELHYYRSGYWPVDGPHLALSTLHALMIVFSLAAFAALIRWRPREPAAADPLQQRLVLGYAAAMVGLVTAFSVVEQQLTGSISAYLLGVAAFSMLFYSTPRFSFWVCTASFLGLIGGSLWVHRGSPVMWHHVFVAFDAVVVFWIGSRVVYSLKAANYFQLVTIQQQARQLATSNAELARSNRFKTDLLTRAAHDLRDPLGSIALSAQTLREELPAASPLQPIVAGIDNSARHLAEFVGNLLTDARTDGDQVRLDRVPTDLTALVANVVVQFRPMAEAKSIALHFSANPATAGTPPVQLDAAHFRPVVENLVSNALKFSPPHRNVWVEVGHQPGEGHRIVVRDEGPGLTPADQSRLFGKYQRLSARPTNGETSTGLGLFIVRQLVALHEGSVWAESPGAGQGARFIVTLP